MKTKIWMLAAMLVASMWAMTAAALTTTRSGCCSICANGNNCDDCCASPCCADKSCCTDACC